MKRLASLSLIMLLASIALMAAIPKEGPKIILTLHNRMLNQEAYLQLKGLTAFYEYYLVARTYPIKVSNPSSLTTKAQDTSYEIRADIYESTITACGVSRAGVISLKRNTRLVFPLCEKMSNINLNQGEPNVEKISTIRAFPGVYEEYWCVTLGIKPGECTGGAIADALQESWYREQVIGNDYTKGDAYNDGEREGLFYRWWNGNQVRWAVDFYNWYNGGTDVFH